MKSHLLLPGLKEYEPIPSPQERFSFTSAVSCLAKTCKTSSKWKYIIHPHDYFINLHSFSTVFSHVQKVLFFSFYSSQIMNKFLFCTDIKNSLSPAQCQGKDSRVGSFPSAIDSSCQQINFKVRYGVCLKASVRRKKQVRKAVKSKWGK